MAAWRATRQASRRREAGRIRPRPVAARVPADRQPRPDVHPAVTSLVMDERMPANRKALLAGAAGYLVLGRDLIPDDVADHRRPR